MSGPFPSSTLFPGVTTFPGVPETPGEKPSPSAPPRVTITGDKPPLDLSFEVTDAHGTRYRWGPDQPATHRPLSFSFRTKLGEGFSDAGLTLQRRIDLDWPDTANVNDVLVTGADGSVAYEGMVVATPRTVSDEHSIGVTLAGWVKSMSLRPFTAIYVDRDQSAWNAMTVRRRAQLLPLNYIVFDPETRPDPNTSLSALSLVTQGAWVAPFKPITEAWYDAGPTSNVSQMRWRLNARGAIVTTDAAWDITPNVAADDIGTSVASGSDFTGATPGNEVAFVAPTPRRFAFFQSTYQNTPSGGDNLQYFFDLSKVAVYGDHGVPLVTGDPAEPPGVRASDVLRDVIERYCPKLDTSGILDTTYVIQHLAYKDTTTAYQVALDVNKYHLWGFGVWDSKRVVFAPYNLADADWEIRTRDPGVEFSPQGDSVDDLFNGVIIEYSDVLTGRTERLTPDVHPDLADDADENVWGLNGLQAWKTIQLSTPQTTNQALEIGRAALADTLRPKQPGAITVRGHLRDRVGNWQQGWKVRAGDTVMLTDFPNDMPRLITETSWDDETKTLTLTLDAPASTLDAFMDRQANAQQAAGLA